MAILLIHGGAGTIAERFRASYEAGLQAAAAAGYAALTGAPAEGRPRAAAAVLAAVTNMESNPEAFNAGVGGALTRDGKAELDACIMVSGGRVSDGRASGGGAGAVAGVTNTPNPVLVADLVRRTTPHVLLIGAGAEELVSEPVPNEALITERSRAALERWRAGATAQLEQPAAHGPTGSNTVGAVALDDEGHLAAATSTGGRVGQWRGRVGDAPLPGLGTYADELVAVSCTGKGEAFMEAVTAGKLAAALAAGVGLEEAMRRALDDVARLGGDGGIIAVTRSGQLAVGFNSHDMAYAIRAAGVEEAGVDGNAAVRVMQLG